MSVTYRGWQPERSGFWGSLSITGAAEVCLAAASILIPLSTQALVGELLGVPLAAALLGAAFLRIGGLTADQWCVLAIKHQIAVAGRRNVFFSGVFTPRDSKTQRQGADLPGVLARLRILSVPLGAGEELGVVHDPRAGTYTAVLEVRYPGLALTDEGRVEARVAAWGAFLRGHCIEGGPIVRIAVHERSLPDDGTALRAWTEGALDPRAPLEARTVVDELVALGGPVANSRSTYLTLTLSAARARLAIRGAGGGQLGACAVLVRELQATLPSIAAADLQVVARLAPRALAQVIKTAYDPHAAAPLAARAALAHTHREDPAYAGLPAGIDPDLAGPSAAEAHWSHYRHDGAVSVTYQVRGWPDGNIAAGSLLALMSSREYASRSMTMLYEPLGPRRARSELSRARTGRDVARRVRARTGQAESMDERSDLVKATEQDAQRVSGHGIVRFTALVVCTVTDEAYLETACAELQQDGAAAGLELSRLWGAQHAGFAAGGLPLGQGLPDKRVI